MLSFISPVKTEPEQEGVSSPRLLFSPSNSLCPLLIFIFSYSFWRKGKEGRQGGVVNESGTLACDNCHAEWTSPLFIGYWNSIHCLRREVIKAVEIQTLLSCQLSERNFFSPSSPDAFVCCGVRLLCEHIQIMASEKCIHAADYLDPAMPLTIVPGHCV